MNGQAKDADKVPISAGKSVLVVSHSNVSVDGVKKRLSKSRIRICFRIKKTEKFFDLDGGELKGILGKYGPCVKCSEKHFKYKI